MSGKETVAPRRANAELEHPKGEEGQPLPPRVLIIVAAAIVTTAMGLNLTVQGLATAEPAFAAGTEVQRGELSVWLDSSQWLEHAHDSGGGITPPGIENDHDHPEDGTTTPDGDKMAGGDEVSSGDVAEHDHDDGDADHDHGENGDGAFAMPSAMMGGGPAEGQRRLQIDITYRHRGIEPAVISPEHFRLENGDAVTWPAARGGTFATTTLQGGHTLHTILAFDVAEESVSDDLRLIWSADGEETSFALVEAEEHTHG